MDNSMQSQSNTPSQNPNLPPIVTQGERQTTVQRFITNHRWPAELANKVETEAFRNSQGNRTTYVKYINHYFQTIQGKLQNRSAQQNSSTNPNGMATTSLIRPTQPTNVSQDFRYATASASASAPTQNPPRMINPQVQQPINRPNQSTLFSQPTVNLTHNFPSTNPQEFSPFQNRFQQNSPSNSLLRPRTATTPNQNISFPSPTISSDPNSNYVSSNSTAPVISLSSDQVFQHVLSTGTNTLANRMGLQPRAPTANLSTRPMRPMNPTATSLRPQSTSIVALQPTSQTSTVPLATNLSAPPTTNLMTNSIVQSVVGPTATNVVNRPMTTTGRPITSPDNDVIELIKYLKENVDRFNFLIEKFARESNTEKVRHIQNVQQQIHTFINNPTHELLPNARKFRDILEQIINRTTQVTTNVVPQPQVASPIVQPVVQPTLQPIPQPVVQPAPIVAQQAPPPPPPPPQPTSVPVKPVPQPTLSVFDQCSKSAQDFLQRDPKDRRIISKRYLEPLNDVINGVPHKILRLDYDQNGKIRQRSTKSLTFLSLINDEINKLPSDLFSIERLNSSRTIKTTSNCRDEQLGLTFRCKLISHSNPIVPPLVIHLSSSYPDQPPVILSLTKSPTPKLDFAEGNSLLEKISNIFIGKLFQLAREHTFTDILDIWRQSVQTAI